MDSFAMDICVAEKVCCSHDCALIEMNEFDLENRFPALHILNAEDG